MDQFESQLAKRATRQRRWMILGALWVLAWVSLFGNDLLRYNDWRHGPAWHRAVFALLISPFAFAIFFLPVALVGRALGSIPKLRRFRYALVLGLPLLLAVAIQIPTALDRIQPERRFEDLAGVPFPAEATLLDYRSISAGIDFSVEFEFRAPEDSLRRLIEDLGWGPGTRTGSTEIIQSDHDMGGISKLTIDWSRGTAVFEYADVRGLHF